MIRREGVGRGLCADAVDPDLRVVRLAQRRATRDAALAVLYERYRKRVLAIAVRIVGNANDAADVLQEVFIQLLRRIHRFESRASFSSWIYRIAVNASIDVLRRRRSVPRLSADLECFDRPVERGPLTAPELRCARHDLRERVTVAVNRLSDRLRTVVLLRYLEDLSYVDIAEILDCPLGTVKSRLNRAHALLRHHLAPRTA